METQEKSVDTPATIDQNMPPAYTYHTDEELRSKHPSTALDIPRPNFRRGSTADTLSIFSADDLSELHLTRTESQRVESAQPDKENDTALRRWARGFWLRNKGVLSVLLSQFFGTMMGVTTRFLELEGEGMHPFQVRYRRLPMAFVLTFPLQILFARMSITVLLSLLYMWWKKIPDAPLGAKGVRALLVLRGVGGFFGVFGLYCTFSMFRSRHSSHKLTLVQGSLQYLPIADATVIGFLSPTLASYACSKLINEKFTRVEQIAGGVSFLGVILIAQPAALFSAFANTPTSSDAVVGVDRRDAQEPQDVTPAHRLEAIGMALVAVFGAACAYTTIKWIGQRAHPLISVNYFASWCTIVSTVALLTIPGISFTLPATLRQWGLLLSLGICGYVMQFLLTYGLRYEKGSRAQNMVYVSMLFALASDKVIFGTTPGLWSVVGSALILSCAVWVAMQKAQTVGSGKEDGPGSGLREPGAPRDIEEEAVGLMAGEGSAGGVEMDTLDGDGREESQRSIGRQQKVESGAGT